MPDTNTIRTVDTSSQQREPHNLPIVITKDKAYLILPDNFFDLLDKRVENVTVKLPGNIQDDEDIEFDSKVNNDFNPFGV